jgi:DNA-directed RNA polymerase subunit RPC12/RpoP
MREPRNLTSTLAQGFANVTDEAHEPPSEPLPEGVPEKGIAPEDASLDFRCENCAAVMAWDPEADALACEFCGHRREVEAGADVIREYGLDEAGAAAHGLGLEMRAARCEVCGAKVAFDDAAVSKACVFCGSPRVLVEEARRNAIRPESLVPLDVGRDGVEKAFRKWLKGLWFRPNALKRLKTFQAIGVYVPYWTYDCHVRSVWTAQAGYHYWVNESYTTRVNGKTVRRTRRVRKTRWVPAAGERDDDFDDIPVLGSKGIDEGLADKLGEFDRTALVPYRPEYLAGWAAEEYQVPLADGWERGQEKAAATQRGRCARDVPGDTQRFLHVRNSFSRVRWKHVLLPMWGLSFDWKGERYPVLIHGQTGQVVGKAPWSTAKIVLAVLCFVVLPLVLVVGLMGGFGLMSAL